MTREEAIHVLDTSDLFWVRPTEEEQEALSVAVEALKTAEQIRWERDTAIQQLAELGYGLGEKPRTDGDCISRQALYETLCRIWDKADSEEFDKEVFATIKDFPSAQPEQKKGEWIDKEDPYGFFEIIPVCSECGHTTKMREKYNFCPNCGARMER